MSRFAGIALRGLVVLLALGFVGYRYLLGREPVPEQSGYALDLDEIRRLAASLPGERPSRVNHEQIAEAPLPRGAVFAGESLRTPHPMSHGAYQLVFPDGYLVIDSGFDAAALRQMNAGATLDAEGHAAIQRALAGARTIVITHEHLDHLTGIARFAEPEQLVGRLLMTREQLANAKELDAIGFPDSLRNALTPLDYERYAAVAPGVVLVKAAGHTPGSQMVFAQLADGGEWLFLGDVAWHMDQIRKLWYRPRLVTDFFLHEDRDAVLAQFRALHELAATGTVQLIASHDVDQRRELVASGKLGAHFQF